MNILVTGGAGFIGLVAVKKLLEAGHDVVCLDNLALGRKELVPDKAIFVEVDICDKELLSTIFQKNSFDAVMHFAAWKDVGESMQNPTKYSQNITGTINILDCMAEHNVKHIIFSSSAVVYSNPEYMPFDENHTTDPMNYYGFTKLECERVIKWYSKIHNLQYTIFRYFNVAGDGGIGYKDKVAKNIMPILVEVVAGKREKLSVFGADYDTDDGTCVRDYVDVNDLVDAHIKALKLEESHVINLGTGTGTSVKELINYTNEIIGKEIPVEYVERREGDPPILVTSYEKAKEILDWQPVVTSKEMLENMIKQL